MVDNSLLTKTENKSSGKVMGVKLNDNDLAHLNLRLTQEGFETFSEFIHAFIDRKYPHHEKDVQVEMLLKRMREKGITDPLTGEINPTFWRNIDSEDMLKDLLKKFTYKKHARDLVGYYQRYVEIFFTRPQLIQDESGHKRAWICDAMRKFGTYYDRKFHNPELSMLIDEIIHRYELNKKMRIHDRVWLADEGYIEQTVSQVLKVEGEIGNVIKFAFFSGLRATEVIYTFETDICPDLTGCDCEKLHIMHKPNGYSIIVLNRIVGQKHSYFTIVPTALWNLFRNLPIKVTKQEMNIAHEMVKSVTEGKAVLIDLRKFHYNILCRSEMREQGAEVLAGRAKSISAKHYLIYELDTMTEQYGKVMSKFVDTKPFLN